MEIINEGLPSSGDQIVLDEIICKYIQEPDCTEGSNAEYQEITFSSRDGGGGKFINISTKSWSINGDNSEEELISLINDFKNRMNYVSNNGTTRSSWSEILEKNTLQQS